MRKPVALLAVAVFVAAAAAPARAQNEDIVDTAVAAGSFETLVKLVTTGVAASNGVIHVVEKVLIPPK